MEEESQGGDVQVVVVLPIQGFKSSLSSSQKTFPSVWLDLSSEEESTTS